MKTVSLVIPVYYNAESLPHLFAELCKIEDALGSREMAMELIFVDDGSGDSSLEELFKIKTARPQTKIIRLTRNFGATHASKTGLTLVTGDCFLTLAADLQDPPVLILEMVDRWKRGDKFIICARRSRTDPPVSKLLAGVYYRLLRLMVVPDYPNGGYDLALMDGAFLPYLLNSSKNLNPPLFAYWLGFRPTILQYDRRPRMYGRSRWKFSKRFKFFLDGLLGFSVTPIRVISALGLSISVLSMLYGFVLVINTLRGHANVRGFPTLAALISFLLGLVIVMLGIIGEYVWRIFDEVNKRPETVIDEIY